LLPCPVGDISRFSPFLFKGRFPKRKNYLIISPTPELTPSATPIQSEKTIPNLTPSPLIPEFPSWIILSVVTIATSLAVIFVRRKKSPN
jgi:hypothetical protein